MRLQAALLAPLFLVLAVAALGGGRRPGPDWRVAAVLGLCLLVLIPLQLIEESQARRARLPGIWMAFAPTMLVLGLGLRLGPELRRCAALPAIFKRAISTRAGKR